MSLRLGTSAPRVVDLFAGAGLFSFAFAREGFRLIRAIELDRAAAATYAENLGHHVEVADVRRIRPEGRCEVLIGGPPCQGFSTLGKRRPRDPRNRLSLQMVEWARVLKPRVVVVENVPSFLDSPVWTRLRDGFECLGYTVEAHVVNAFDFGVPQLRSRSITFATRGRPPRLRPVCRAPVRTVRQALAGLPLDPDNVNFHYAPRPGPLALARMKVIPSGGDKRDVMRRAPRLAAPSWWRVARDVTDVWGRMEWDAPSNTLRTALLNASKGRYIHPTRHRVVSLREAARLQSIPDEWTFVGDPYPIARQIGNSVPPRLGQAVARAVAAVV